MTKDQDQGPGPGHGQGGPGKPKAEEKNAEVEVSRPQGLEAWERRLWSKGSSVVAGTDEAGRGPLAGPVVAAAFAVLKQDDEEVLELMGRVNDSKQVSEKQREDLFRELTDEKFEGRTVWAIAESSVTEIDEGNILLASLGAMARAVQALKVRPDHVLVDGCNRPPDLLPQGERWTRGSKKDIEAERNQSKLSMWFKPVPKAEPKTEELPWKPKRVEAVIEGDGLVPSISAASILAKVHRDHQMEALHKTYPAYGFNVHKGYGTESHMEAIKKHGLCPEHRRSFKPIRQMLGNAEEQSEVDALEQESQTPSPSSKRNDACSAAFVAAGKAEALSAETPCKQQSLKRGPPRGDKGKVGKREDCRTQAGAVGDAAKATKRTKRGGK